MLVGELAQRTAAAAFQIEDTPLTGRRSSTFQLTVLIVQLVHLILELEASSGDLKQGHATQQGVAGV